MGAFEVPVGALNFAPPEAVFSVCVGASDGVVKRVRGVVPRLLPVPLRVGLSGLLSAHSAGKGDGAGR
jgi:hypothetical protein